VRPDERELDDEIRGHLALSVKERIDAGADPETARLAALREFGYVPAIRDSMKRVWIDRVADAATDLGQEMRFALRSLLREPSLAATVVVTLALGIGANAAVFSVVREVLLRPLVNREADRLIYIRQSAPGLDAGNTMFSVPELADLTATTRTIAAFGDFSTIDMPALGFGEPRVVLAGIVSGRYFEVMGLEPALGRLITPEDDGPAAAPVVVLTHRFWSDVLDEDPAIVGHTVRLGTRAATVIGVLEPSVTYPTATEIIANVVASPHHLGATMVTERTHRMSELFGRLAPEATPESAQAELTAAHEQMVRAHPEVYPASAGMRVTVTPLGRQITAPAREVLMVLLCAAALVFVIACANVASLMLARAVRRESELAVRAALGASRGALRRTLLGESLVLCGAGAALGLVIAAPMAALIAQYAATFSVPTLEASVDPLVLGVGAALALAAAVGLALVPRLPDAASKTGAAAEAAGARPSRSAGRRLRVFATSQVALSFVLLTSAGVLLLSLVTMLRASSDYDLRRVIAFDVPMPIETPGDQAIAFFEDATRRIARLPQVERVAMGNFVPWRDSSGLMPPFPFTGDEVVPVAGEELPRARLRIVSPGFFATLGIPRVAGRDFTAADRQGSNLVVVVSQSVARRLFGSDDVLGRHVWWVGPLFGAPAPRRIVGVVADVDDERVVAGPAATIYHPFHQLPHAGRLFVRASGDPYAIVGDVTTAIHKASVDQPVAHGATLSDIRAEVLAPERLSAFVVAAFGGIALLIAVVGVAGVLAFSVSARTREFGVRLAVGGTPRSLLVSVLGQGIAIAVTGIAVGAIGGFAVARAATAYSARFESPSLWPMVGAAAVLVAAAVVASLVPARRAARVDVTQALRTE
jgi:putative ABC transport system permease protein